MGAADPPYLYDAPTQRPISFPYSQYDPKAVTKAAWETASRDSQRPQLTPSGPLINFNRHPDSYMIVGAAQHEFKTMPKSTKRWVAVMRWLLFTLRVLSFFAAAGALFCSICLKPTDQTQAWIMRITSGYDVLVTVYAVYHLVRSSTARTPGSSASYHFFSFIMDACFIPFYAFYAIFTSNTFALAKTDPNYWASFFPLPEQTAFVILFAFCIACSLAGAHFVAVCFDLYLVVVFRKISNLPPDMNPLEDNLTSRKSSKHKYKNSELSLASTAEDKHPGFYSGSTLGGSVVNVNGSRLSIMDKKQPDVRQVAFAHSRAGSDLSFSPHNPNSARLSRQNLETAKIYQQAQSVQTSAQSLARPQSFVTATSGLASPRRPGTTESVSPQRKVLTNDNWYVLPDPDVDGDIAGRPLSNSHQLEREPRLPVLQVTNSDDRFVHQPLGMNPPTPSPEHQQQRNANLSDRHALGEVAINRSLTVASDNTVASSVYSESAPSLQSSKVRSTPKSKYYGDLAAAARGVRGYSQLPQSANSPVNDTTYNRQSSPERSPSPGKRNGRVLSRSGADIADENTMFIPEKSSRRRMVSGKAAEEGLGGFWR